MNSKASFFNILTNQRALKSPNHSIAAYFPPSCSQGFDIGNCQTWYWGVTCSTFGISLTAPVTFEDEGCILYTSVCQRLAQSLRGTLYTVDSQQRLVWKICLIWYEFNESLLSLHWHFSFLAIHRHTHSLRNGQICSGKSTSFVIRRHEHKSWLCNLLAVCGCCLAAAAAAAKSLQSGPTLCDPIDGSPPGSPIPGILQARTLEWVAISFSNAWKWKVKVKLLSRVRL